MRSLSVRLFGAPEIRLDGAPVSFDTRKAVALVAYLAVTARPHRREHLASLLWPESDHARARASLRRTLSVATAVGPALTITRSEVLLDPTNSVTDVREFQQLVASGRPDDLPQAVTLATGPFLDGFSLRDSVEFDDWTAVTAERLQVQLCAALAQLTALHVATGDLAAALEHARRWVAGDPLSEPAHRQLMRIYTWTGQRTAALRQFRACVRALDRELSVPPLPETSELYDDIRANRLGAPTPPAATLGRQPDRTTLSRREPGSAAGPPLVGRTTQLEDLLDRWRQSMPAGGSVAVVADPGMGRTALVSTLSIEVGGQGGRVIATRGHVAEAGLAMVGMVDIARELALHDPAVTELLESIGTPLNTPGELTALLERLRAAVGRVLSGSASGLLVIDDAQWLDQLSRDFVRYLMRRPPIGVLVVTTWRGGLDPIGGPPDLPVISLPPLQVHEVGEVLAALDRGDLDQNEVLQRTAGVPRLVVEYGWAAETPSPLDRSEWHAQVVARLDAAPAATRQLLSTVAVVGGAADPHLLRSVSGRDEAEVVDALEDAVSRGLLVEDRQRGGYDVPYDAMRQVVLDRVSLARIRLLHRRAADTLIRRHSTDPHSAPAAIIAGHLAAAGEREDEAREWYWCAAQTSIARYAHQDAIDLLRSAQAMGYEPARVHAALGDVLTTFGRYDDAIVAYEQAAATTPATDERTLAAVETKLAGIHERLGDWAVAQEHLQSALDLLVDDPDVTTRGAIEAALALAMHRQDMAGAQAHAEHALELAGAGNNDRDSDVALSQVHNVLGALALDHEDEQSAEHHLRASLHHAEAAEHLALQVAARNNLSRMSAQTGDLESAMTHARVALELGVQHGDVHRVAALNDHLADLLHQAGRDEEAMAFSRAAASSFGQVAEARGRPEIWTLVSW